MTVASLTRRTTVSVRLLGLTDRRARRAAHGGSHGSGDDGTGYGTGRGALLNSLAACGGGKGGDGENDGNSGAFHGVILPMAELERCPPPPVPVREPKFTPLSGIVRRQ